MEKMLFEVEQELPKEKRARQALVRHFVVMAASETEAICLAKHESSTPIGDWTASRAEGAVVCLRSTVRS
jgi:hypothetical protein